MSQGQKTCRTIAWAFSIATMAIFAIIAIIFFIEYASVKSIIDTGIYPEMDAVFLPAGIVLIILAVVQIVFIQLNAKARKDEYQHIALGVCQIIFGDLVSGILILCSGGKPKTTHKIS